MKFLERDLENIIFYTNNDKLNERGLEIDGKKKRQVLIGNYGILDLITFKKGYEDCDNIKPIYEITIYELKKDIINANTFFQAVRYLKGVKNYFLLKNIKRKVFFKIILIGESVCFNEDFIYLVDLISNNEFATSFDLNIYTYKYEIDGLTFEEKHGYSLREEGFNV